MILLIFIFMPILRKGNYTLQAGRNRYNIKCSTGKNLLVLKVHIETTRDENEKLVLIDCFFNLAGMSLKIKYRYGRNVNGFFRDCFNHCEF